jgi:hypothetical protein
MVESVETPGLGGDGARPSNEHGWRERVRPAMAWLVGGWAAGVALGLGRHARQWAALRRLRRVPLMELSPEWRERFAGLCARCAPRLGLPRIGETSLVRVPQVLGGWAPVILLPAGFLAGLPPVQVEAVLAHELAHLVRRDFWLNLLQSVAEAVFFFHPAVHAFNAHIRRERERACDDLAVEWTRDTLGYARALATLAGALPSTPTPGRGVLAADGHEPGDLRARIGRLLGRPVTSRLNWAPGGWLVAGALMAYAALFAASPVIVAQVMSPEERVKVVRKAMQETQRRDSGSTLVTEYPEGEITIISELRTEDGSLVPEEVTGSYETRNGGTGGGGMWIWEKGRAETKVARGRAKVVAVPDEWAPVVIYDVEPEPGASALRVPPLVLRKGKPLRVRLSAPDGGPLPGLEVKVVVSPREAPEFRVWIDKRWVTDANGVFVVQQADPAFRYAFSVGAKDRQNTRRDVLGFKDGETVSWVLPGSRPIRGQVVDKANGDPVSGAGVWLAGALGVEGVYGQEFDETPLATTDAEGRFELPGWGDAGTYALRFAHAGHANALVGARPGETLRVELDTGVYRVAGRLRVLTERARQYMDPPRLSITGWISSGNGASFAPPLVECKITKEGTDTYRFEADRLPGGRMHFSPLGVMSRADLVLRGDRPDLELVMNDRWLEFAEGSADAVALKATERKLVEAESKGPKRALEIVLKASDGGQAPDCSLAYLVTPANLPRDMPSRNFKYGKTVGGKLVSEAPARAKVTVRTTGNASPAGYWIPDHNFEVPDGEGTHRHEIPAYPAGVAVVEVLGEDGLDLAFGRLGLEGRDPVAIRPKPGRFSIEAVNFGSSKSSRATLGCVPIGGRYRVVALEGARVARSEWFTLDAARPRRDVQVRFSEGRPVTARVKTSEGTPVAGVRVALAYQSEEIGYAATWVETIRTTDEGAALFHSVTVDELVRYRLEISSDRDWQPQVLVVSATKPEEWTAILRPGLKLRGRVVDAAGRPVADARVAADVDVGDDWEKAAGAPRMEAEKKTDAEGRFSFSNLVPGRVCVRVEQRSPVGGSGFPRLEMKGDAREELLITVE